MIRCSPGDVVLVRFPFTDLAGSKHRPAVLISPVEFSARRHDVVLLALTSQPQTDDSLKLGHWRQSKLPKPTWFKPLIATLSGGLVTKRLGALSAEDRARAVAVVRGLIAPEFR